MYEVIKLDQIEDLSFFYKKSNTEVKVLAYYPNENYNENSDDEIESSKYTVWEVKHEWNPTEIHFDEFLDGCVANLYGVNTPTEAYKWF